MSIVTRPAHRSDAESMCRLLNTIIIEGGTTAHREPFSEEKMIAAYIEAPLGIACTVAVDGDDILGFQSLEWPDHHWSGDNALPSGWAVIATYVAQATHGQGIGRLLFSETIKAAETAGVKTIDATIRHENTGGLAYYSRMGFVDYRQYDEACAKRFDLT